MRRTVVLICISIYSIAEARPSDYLHFYPRKYYSHTTNCASFEHVEGVSKMRQPTGDTKGRGHVLAKNGVEFLHPHLEQIPSDAGRIANCIRLTDSSEWQILTPDHVVDFVDTIRSKKFNQPQAHWQRTLPGLFLGYEPERAEVDSVLQVFRHRLDSSMVRIVESDIPRFMGIFGKDSAGRVNAFQDWVAPRHIDDDDSLGLYYMDTTGLGYYYTPDISEKDTAWVLHRLYVNWGDRFMAQIKGLTYRVSRNGTLMILDERWFLLAQRIRVFKLPPCFLTLDNPSCGE